MTDSAKWFRMPSLGFDLETTGVNAHTDRMVQAALVRHNPEADDGVKPFTWLVNPGVPIPEEASAVHGITDEKVQAEGQDPGEVLFELTGKLALWLGKGWPVVGANLSYDLTMLEAENRRHRVDTLASRLNGRIGPIIDVQVLDKAADKYRPNDCSRGGARRPPCGCGATDKTLASLCKHYGVTLAGAHDAGADALAAVLLWPKIIHRHPETFRGFTLGALHQAQIQWRADQANSLRRYFDDNAIEHDGVCPEWPLHVRCGQVETVQVQEALL